ncbi:GTPase inhibitor [Histoplasma capsulatum G186AR]|uniref:GTPase inhibitor n=1 Tax=Ajellomyces capsulatus (strain G186AR / H82 / ATCC MYA-2454 / RMSCC 2432) TaxID=447093 RepID=C0NE62_AJECG|nr:GTPase inhibitor [Histoplasma capsulatum G186AR]EEH10510.1 GTPase inhibitor [Histoplasma capsulatum G186AR]
MPPRNHDLPSDEDDNDALFAALEREEDNPSYKAQRIEQLQSELAARAQQQQEQHQKNSSSNSNKLDDNNNATTFQNTLVPTLPSDQSLLDFTTRHPRCVIHFSHPDFARCAVMDRHIHALAGLHHETRFATVDVRRIPFVVEKLKVKVLPCVIGFVDGVGVERIVGFEGLGYGGRHDADEEFRSGELERRLLRRGCLVKRRIGEGDEVGSDIDGEEEEEVRRERGGRGIRGGVRRGREVGDDDDGDDDWD